MKILKFFLFTAAIFTMAACSSDDDGGSSSVELTTANIAGTYEVVFYEGTDVESIVTGSGNTTVVETISFTTDTFTNAIYTVTAAGTYSASGGYRTTFVTTAADGSSETEFEITSFDTEDAAFSINSTNRTLTLDGEVWEVTRFDADELFLTLNAVEIEDNSTFTIEEEIRLVRVN